MSSPSVPPLPEVPPPPPIPPVPEPPSRESDAVTEAGRRERRKGGGIGTKGVTILGGASGSPLQPKTLLGQ